MTEEEREVLTAIEERKIVGEETCDSCVGTGADDPYEFCKDCLGQGVLLTEHEYNVLLRLSGRLDGDILDAEIIE